MKRSTAVRQAMIQFDKTYPSRDILSIYVTEHRDYFDILIKSRDKYDKYKLHENNYVVWKNFEKVEEYND